MSKDNNEVSWTKEIPPTDPDLTKSESHNDICSKNHRNTSDGMGVWKLLSDNSKSPIDNYDIGKVDKVTWTEEMPPTNLDCIKSKSYANNYDKNSHNNNKVGGEERRLDNLESPE